jgi:hypothetical protein
VALANSLGNWREIWQFPSQKPDATRQEIDLSLKAVILFFWFSGFFWTGGTGR